MTLEATTTADNPGCDVRLTREFAEQVIFLLALVPLSALDANDEHGGGPGKDEHKAVEAFFKNVLKTFTLREEADRIENAMRRAR